MDPMNSPSPEAAENKQPQQAAEAFPTQNLEQTQSRVQPAEQLPAAPEQAPGAMAPPSIPVPPMADPVAGQMPQNAQAPVADDVAATTKTKAAKIIEDTDLIEKEWVDKAKKIVERNRDDPYKQSEELTGFRAEYMQKQYNKTIKTDK